MNPKLLKTLAPALLLALLGMGFGYGIGAAFKGQIKGMDLQPAMLALLPLPLLLVLAWHELGHAVGGWLCGFDLYLYAVGPLRIDRVNNHFKLSFNRSASLWGGIAATSPPAGQILSPDSLRRKMLLVASGGPLASLLGATAWLPATALWEQHPYWAFCLGAFALFSFTIFIATMLPIGNSGFVNDGGRILQLLRNQADGQRWCSMASLGALSINARPREWPGHLLQTVTQGAPDTYDGLMAIWMRHQWHLDRKEFTEAKLWLEKGLEHVDAWPAAAQPMLHSSAVYYYAKVEGDSNRARQHLDAARKPGFLPKESVWISEAALLRSEGKPEEARALAERARAQAPPSAGSNRELMEETLAELAS